MKKSSSRRSLPARPAAPAREATRPFSPALMGLCGIVIGLCLVVLSYAFVMDSSPRAVPTGQTAALNTTR
jgi:hypothetical protein